MAIIHPLFKNRAFEPEKLGAMGKAYDLVIQAMPEANIEDVATIIIETAQRGVEDAPTLASSALDRLAEQSRKEA